MALGSGSAGTPFATGFGNPGFTGVSPINTGEFDSQGRKSGDLGFTRFFPGRTNTPIAPKKPLLNWWVDRQGQGNTKIPGLAVPGANPPVVDLFQEQGGYEGIFGIKPETFSTPGQYKLSELLGIPKKTLSDEIQYSPQAGAQAMSRSLADLANRGNNSFQASNGVLSPQGQSAFKK